MSIERQVLQSIEAKIAALKADEPPKFDDLVIAPGYSFTAADTETDMGEEITDENYDEMVDKAIGVVDGDEGIEEDIVPDTELSDEETDEQPEKDVPEGDDEGDETDDEVGAEKTVSILDKMIDMVTLLVRASPPDETKVASKQDVDAMASAYIEKALKYARIVDRVAAWKDDGPYKGKRRRWMWTDQASGARIYRYTINQPAKDPSDNELGQARKKFDKKDTGTGKPKKKDEPKKKVQQPKAIKPKKKPKKEEKPSGKSPDWYDPKKPMDTSNENMMESGGFTRKKVDLSSASFVNVKTGQRFKFDELSKETQDNLTKQNESKGMWVAPKKGQKQAPAGKKTPAPKEYQKAVFRNKDNGYDYSWDELKPEVQQHFLKRTETKKKMDKPSVKKKFTKGKKTLGDLVDHIKGVGKAASMRRGSRSAAKGLQMKRKNVDTMTDTGGGTKRSPHEPKDKPPRDDISKPFNTKKKTPSERDPDTDSDPDLKACRSRRGR